MKLVLASLDLQIFSIVMHSIPDENIEAVFKCLMEKCDTIRDDAVVSYGSKINYALKDGLIGRLPLSFWTQELTYSLLWKKFYPWNWVVCQRILASQCDLHNDDRLSNYQLCLESLLGMRRNRSTRAFCHGGQQREPNHFDQRAGF